ncbi:hypothetical protein DL98DRAFT_516183 [Cadophora sp. DSE1049]|nr:hypothetical protein DL98DRAFT_516183 [Cadophora sp. DSE1049]
MSSTLAQSHTANKVHNTAPPEHHPVSPTRKPLAKSMSTSVQTSIVEPASFSALLYELREQIWLYTLQSRLIYLHLHEVYPKAPDDIELLEEQGQPIPHHEQRRISALFNYSIYFPDTTPANAFALYAKDTIASLETKRNSHSGGTTWRWNLEDFKLKSPGPPAALNVCRESREIAIKKGYVLAFKPVNLKRKGNSPEAKGIWVDFERDTIMFNTKPRHELMHPRTDLYEFLLLLMKVLPEDVARIKSIALRGDLIGILETLKDCREEVINSEVSEWQRFPGYSSLKQIWVDDEFHVDRHERNHTRSLTHTPSPLFKGNEQAMEEFLKARLVRNDMYANPPIWPWGVPLFKVVRGEGWKEYF